MAKSLASTPTTRTQYNRYESVSVNLLSLVAIGWEPCSQSLDVWGAHGYAGAELRLKHHPPTNYFPCYLSCGGSTDRLAIGCLACPVLASGDNVINCAGRQSSGPDSPCDDGQDRPRSNVTAQTQEK